MSEPRVIKRYSNRKLYDMQESMYITLQDVGDLVQQGVDLVIIDNKTKEDITSVTMAQIVYEQQKSNKGKLPLGALKEIVLSGGERLGRKIATPLTSLREEVHSLKEEAERRVTTLREQAERRVMGILHDGRDKTEDAKTLVAEVSAATSMALDDWAKALEERIRNAVGVAGVAHGEAGKLLEERLHAMESRLETIEHRLNELEGAFQGKTRD